MGTVLMFKTIPFEDIFFLLVCFAYVVAVYKHTALPKGIVNLLIEPYFAFYVKVVQRIPVRIGLDPLNGTESLRLGMSVVPIIHLD